MSDLLRRDFLKVGAAGFVAATVPGQLAGLRSATQADLQGLVGDGRRRRILLRGGAVLSLDARVGDFDKADVLIDGTKIAAVAPNMSASVAGQCGGHRLRGHDRHARAATAPSTSPTTTKASSTGSPTRVDSRPTDRRASLTGRGCV